VTDAKYIGLDVHQATISAAVLDSTGKLVMESILETKAATILQGTSRKRARGLGRRNLCGVATRSAQATRCAPPSRTLLPAVRRARYFAPASAAWEPTALGWAAHAASHTAAPPTFVRWLPSPPHGRGGTSIADSLAAIPDRISRSSGLLRPAKVAA
jgi:hypothetical protein